METLWKYLEDLVGKGLDTIVIAEFIFYSAIHLIPLALPLAILLSSIMTFGNLGERYELVAIKSSGVSLIKAMRPMFIVAIILALAAFYSSNILIPKANLSWGALLYDVLHKKPGVNLTDNVFYKDIDGYAIKVGHKHKDNETLDDILIYVKSSKTNESNTIVMAKSGKMFITKDERYMILELHNGVRYTEMDEDPKYRTRFQHNQMEFAYYKMALDLSELQFTRTKKELFKEDYRMLNVAELDVRIDSMQGLIDQKSTYLATYILPYFTIPNDTFSIPDVKLEDRKIFLEKNTKSRDIKQADTSGVLAIHSIFKKEKKHQNSTEPVILRISEKSTQGIKNMASISKSNAEDMKAIRQTKARYVIEWHKKFTLAFSVIILFFIGAPLGSIIRKGGFGLPFVFSILIFIVYYVLNVIGEKMVKEGALNSIAGMWLSTAILLPVALWLTYKASTDSQLFDADFYKVLRKKLSFKRNADSSNQ